MSPNFTTMQGHRDSHICNFWGKFLPVGTFCTTTDTIPIPVGAMYLYTRTFCTLANITFIRMVVMYLHVRMFCTLADLTFIPMGAMYLHARTFCTLADMTFIPLGAMYLHQECSAHSLIKLLYPQVRCVYLQARSVW